MYGLDLLACPQCGGDLTPSPAIFSCNACGRAYAVREGVPELMLSPPDWVTPDGWLERIAANPVVYDVVQGLAGARKIGEQLRRCFAGAHGVVLDVGAGTGSVEAILPTTTCYVWLDADSTKLTRFRAKSASTAILADATAIPLRDRSVDWSVSIGVSHHLDEASLRLMLDELRRVTRERFVFLDAVASSRLQSRLMWRYDRGGHLRTAEDLLGQIASRFDVASAERFTVRHEYLLAVAT